MSLCIVSQAVGDPETEEGPGSVAEEHAENLSKRVGRISLAGLLVLFVIVVVHRQFYGKAKHPGVPASWSISCCMSCRPFHLSLKWSRSITLEFLIVFITTYSW